MYEMDFLEPVRAQTKKPTPTMMTYDVKVKANGGPSSSLETLVLNSNMLVTN
jgi:hypothetical protein